MGKTEVVKVVNNFHQPIVLESGEILAASGTDGHIKEVELTEGDRTRHLDTGRIALMPEPEPEQGSVAGSGAAATKVGPLIADGERHEASLSGGAPLPPAGKKEQPKG